jgi:ABC-type branched-subunit amino acid transport system ATPase component
MISIKGPAKTYGPTVAVDDVTFTAAPGRVTGFLGPNGAGTSTTMRIMVGLTRPTSGTATVLGLRFARPAQPRTGSGSTARRVRAARRTHRPGDPQTQLAVTTLVWLVAPLTVGVRGPHPLRGQVEDEPRGVPSQVDRPPSSIWVTGHAARERWRRLR